MIDEIAKLFQDNLGNRLTVALANGMIMEIAKLIPKDQTKDQINDNDTATDPNAQ